MTARRIRWLIGGAIISGLLVVLFTFNIPILFHPNLPHISFFARGFFILLMAATLCLLRVMLGPTAPDRIVAIDILGILIVGFCAVLGIPTGRTWYIDVGIAWALQSFISTLALSKYLEGKDLDE